MEMKMLIDKLAAATGAAVVALFLASPASALTMAECSVKYNAAKDAGSLNGQTWNQFRKAECGSDANATDDTKAKKAKSSAADDSKPAKKAKKSTADAGDDSGAQGLTMAECSAKYQAAKSAGTLNGMKWNDFRKSECGAGAETTATSRKASAGTADDGVSNQGLTMAECSAKYQAAKTAGTLNGMKWNDFRKTECGPSGSIAAAPAKKTVKSSSSAADDSGGKGLSMAECSAKYQAAKSGGTLNGMKWNDFRKARCGANASDDDSVPAVDEASYTGDPEKPSIKAPRGVKFPSAVAKKYTDETPGKARMHTCLDQYYANKDADTLNGLRWIQKGGGYYSLCNAKLRS
jgi:hypothetical protein